MRLEEVILDMLDYPAPGYSFNEIHKNLEMWYKIKVSRKTLSRVLKRLVEERGLVEGYICYPNGRVAKIYTHPLNRLYGWHLTRQDLLRLIYRKYKKAWKNLYGNNP